MSYTTKYLYIVFVATLFSVPAGLNAYEPTTTHAGLSQEIVGFYNATHNKKLNSTQKELVIKGSIDEDDPVIRVINHFYDPIYNIGINNSRTAKDWAISINPENEYSWPVAIRHYAEGDEEKAFLALGHIIHLIEDMSVPDHTRNDPHIGVGAKGLFTGESPFESWTSQNKNRVTMSGLSLKYFREGDEGRILSGLSDYFDFLANYSNKNFFSNDTINSKIYNEPVIVSYSGDFGYGRDSNGSNTLKLVIFTTDKNGQKVLSLTDNQDKSVLSGYFDRLSKQAILTGAGVIDLFFKEAEVARKDFLAKQKSEQEAEVAKAIVLQKKLSEANFLSLIAQGFGFVIKDNVVYPVSKTFATVGGGFSSGVNIIGSATVNAGSMVAYTSSVLAKEAVERAVTLVAGVFNTLTLLTTQTDVPNVLLASNPIITKNTNTPVVIKSFASQNMEALPLAKIETVSTHLAPRAPSNIDNIFSTSAATSTDILEAARLLSGQESPKDDLLEVVKGATSTGDVLILVASSTLLNKDGSDALIYIATPIPESQPMSGGGGGSASVTPDTPITTAPEATSTTATTTPITVATSTTPVDTTLSIETASSVVINEIAWGGTPGNPEDEWIELYNKSSQDINLSGFTLHSKTDSSPYINLSGTIPARGYFLIEAKNTGETNEATQSSVKNITADLWTSFGSRLANTGENVVLTYTSTSQNTSATTTIDEIPFCFNWCGVPSSRTTERHDPNSPGNSNTNWSANNAVIYNGLNASSTPITGTPKARNSLNYLINRGSNISSDLALTKSNSPYLINDTAQRVNQGATLTLEPGVVVKFRNAAWLLVDGNIVANGTQADPVVFTAFADDEHGGDMDGVVTTPVKGSWFGVELSSLSTGSSFVNSIFRYGGNYGTGATYRKAMLYVSGVSPSITDSIFENSRAYGVYVDRSDSVVSGNTFRNNIGDQFSTGLYINQGLPNVGGNTFIQNSLGLSVNSSSGTFTNNTFSNNTTAMLVSGPLGAITGNSGGVGDTINLMGSISVDSSTTTLEANPMPYYLSGTVTVPFNSTLDIKEGTVIKNSTLGSASVLNVFGRLHIDTSNNAGVIFSSNEATPRRGAWIGIIMNPGSSSKIKGATIQEAQAGIKYNNSPINLEDVIFSTNTTGVQAISSAVMNATSTIFIDNGTDKSPSNLW
jgi:hypothetical protein